jgi:2'-5' RNA ligase
MQFQKDDGYLLFRSERAGDEFKITSTKDSVADLEVVIRAIWQTDLHRGLLDWNYGVGMTEGEAHVDLYRNRVKEKDAMDISTLSGKTSFIILRPVSEDFPILFNLSEDSARIVEGTPIIDLHLTVQALQNVEDFVALKKRLEKYALSIHPFDIKTTGIARMNVNNQHGKLWLMVEKTPFLENIYNDLGQISSEMGYVSYPYKSKDWLPHMTIVDLPENLTTQINDSTFGASYGITFTVKQLEWNIQKSPENWELLDQFPFSQEPSY